MSLLAALYPYLTPLAVLLGLCAVAITSYFNGNSSVSTSVITTYKTRVDQLEEQIVDSGKKSDDQFAAFTKQVSDLNFKIGQQNGIIQAKDEQIDRLEKILQNRNPELLTVLSSINGSLDGIKEFMAKQHDTMTVVASLAKAAEARDLAVDKGHIMAATAATK